MKKKNLFNIIIGLLVVLYVIFGTDAIDDLKKTTANVSNINTNDVVKAEENLFISFLDVGQADSILINFKDKYMLIDAGNNEDGEKLVKYFNDNNINKFDYVVATHPHEDHIGGMNNIIENFEINTFYMPNKITTTKTFEDVLDAMEKKGLMFNTPNMDEEFSLGDCNIKVIYNGDDTNDINDSSIVLKLTYKNNSFLFTGDATSNVEKIILNKDIKSDVLKVGHHGSSYSSTNDFLDKVSPTYAVIQVGKNNIYKHPTNSTLNKLSKRNIKVFRTDINGTITFSSDGNNINVKYYNTDLNG